MITTSPEKRAATSLRYYLKNAAKIAEQSRLRYQANKHKRDTVKLSEYNRAYAKLNPRIKTPEQNRADNKRYYERHKEKMQARGRARALAIREANPAVKQRMILTPEQKLIRDQDRKARVQLRNILHPRPWSRNDMAKVRDSVFKRKYGITAAEVDRRMAEQNNRCPICERDKSESTLDKRSFLHVDHDHDTGQIRGLLCQKCNRGLGLFNDNIERLLRAVTYLQRA